MVEKKRHKGTWHFTSDWRARPSEVCLGWVSIPLKGASEINAKEKSRLFL